MEKDVDKKSENKMEMLENTLEDEALRMLTNTSCLAIGNIFIRNHPLLKILWAVAFVLCTILTISQLYNLSSNYFSYPLNTVISLKSFHDEFPSITFCNLNPLRKSKINLAKLGLQSFLYNLEMKNFTNDNNNEMDSRLNDEMAFTKLILNETSDNRRKMGHQLNDFILQCYYLGEKCKLDDLFSPLLSNKFGNCFTFNPLNILRKTPIVAKTSRSKGLFITFYVQNNEYLPNFIQSSGIRLHIHETNTSEIPDVYGMTLPTGFQISLGIVPTKIKKLHEIKGNCEEGKVFKRSFNVPYTKKACFQVCLNKLIFQLCGCYDSTFEIFQKNITNLICNSDSKIECSVRVTSDFFIMKGSCNCMESCNSTIYDFIQSFSSWPAATYEKRFFDDLSDIYPNFQNLTKNDMYKVRQNFTNLIIYVEERSHKEISQIRAYTWDSFLSEIGGTLNLYLGICVLTAFEFFESLALLVTYICGKLMYRNSE